MTSYDDFASHYDAWIAGFSDDVTFYVDLARSSGGPIVELGVGTGRVAIPTARAGVPVLGIDASERMLEVCRLNAEAAGVSHLVDLRHGDFRSPPVSESVSLVTCPFTSFLHLETDLDRRDALSAIRAILRPRGRFVFDVFTPAEAGDPARDADWIERAPEIWEKNELDRRQRVIHVTLQHGGRATRLRFRWISREEWRRLFEDCGFTIYACYGWFDLRPCAQEGSHSVWVVERPA